MSFTGDLLDGYAALIAAAGIGTVRSDGSAYQASETAITFGAMPSEPDRAITLTAYPVRDDPSLSDSVVGLQVRTRGGSDPHDVEGLADALFDLLHHPQAHTVGAIRVVQALRNSGGPLGRDENNRWERSDNYYVTVNRPTANRT
ncbi:minor capsid protein [Amycolatopsis sp. NPDC049688]|uniref:minor capsid protein n=1 Tax=Amycolatopsis sp. NPDC049688 TaxID=3154733 RepID=UPI00342F6522